MKIVIVDYGSGNLRSVQRSFERAGFSSQITHDPNILSEATHLVVPGVGAFSDCMDNLEKLQLLEPIREFIKADKPYLGMCLGLQILFSEGTEFGSKPGLGILPGQVLRFAKNELKVPHMGWNQITIQKEIPQLKGIPNGTYFYFVHSYYGTPENKECIATTTDYGVQFPSAIAQGRLFACQFHPEKSQEMGRQLLKNFANL
ncbi:Imidazole glycerol phosphate synthase amidotransferase subunit [hydrothermal vent metagenome]|uniref:Imidazole glycerol phosphate synthase amidotransferase subunit n=1 Tax=hydrothermal vent metagenome TaxID=652676 RepID=A0A3B1CXU5_9ZZZZ